jgi:hypothetical protein
MLGFHPISAEPLAALTHWRISIDTEELDFDVTAVMLDWLLQMQEDEKKRYVIAIYTEDTTVYAATVPFITRTTDIPQDQLFEGTLEASLRVDRELGSGGGGFGGFTENISEVSLINADGLYDSLVDTSLNGQTIYCAIGNMDVLGLTVDPFAQFERVAVLTAERSNIDRAHMVVQCRDPVLHAINQPVQTFLYGGTGGIDGDEQLIGKRRPSLHGHVFNVTPTLVSAADLLYQVHSGTIETINVFDGGVELSLFENKETVTSLLDGALSIPPGYYSTCLAEGYFLLGGANEKQVTATVNGTRLSTAAIAEWVAIKASGKTTLDADRVANFAVLTNGFMTGSSLAGVTYFSNFFSTNKLATGQYVYSIRIDYLPGDGEVGFGFANSLAVVGDGANHQVGWDENSVSVFADGIVGFDGTTTGDVGATFVQNDLIEVAVDLDTREWWYRVNAGNWNNNALANPATNVGGFDLQYGVTGNNYASVSLSNQSRVTVDFTPATLPSGYSTWGQEGTFAIDANSFAAVEASQPATVGYYLNQESNETAADMLSKLLAGIGAFFSTTRLGAIRIDLFREPLLPELKESFDSDGGNLVEVDRIALPSQLDPPPRRFRVMYEPNWTVMTDLFGQTTEDDPGFAERLRREHGLSSTTDAQAEAVLVNYPDAPEPDPINAYFGAAADADTEAQRLYDLYTSGFQTYRFTIKNRLFVYRVGDVVEIIDSRLGLSSGRLLRIVSLTDDVSTMMTEMVGFG